LAAIPPPFLRFFPGILQTYKSVLIQTLQSKPSVEGLDISVVCGLAGPDEVKPHMIPVRPEIDILRDELGAVINPNHSRLSMLLGYPFQDFRDLHPPDPLGYMDGQTFTSMIVHKC
jgi:hypothetical protein